MKPATPAAYDLLHRGAIALAQVEANGICIDVPYIEKTMARTTRKIKRLQEELEEMDVMREWRKKFRSRTNTASHPQLAAVLFDEMGYASAGKTAKGKRATDKEALETIEHPFVDKYLRIQKLQKLVSTNFKGLLREIVDGKLHCFYNLHNVISYRSSSDSVNFQNFPIRDPEAAPLIRRAFVARPGRQLVEIDFSGAEVRTSASCHKDPVMIKYILDPTTDMHRDVAMQLFKLPKTEVAKPIRALAKGNFVFAEFYGDWWAACAKKIWKIARGLKTAGGLSLREHMASKGMAELGYDPLSLERIDPEPGSFGAHVRGVEKDFWGNRFKVYDQWKDDFYEKYQRRGYFELLTGFVCSGYLTKKQVVNYPIQGPSFHCLLWSLIKISAEMGKRGMKSLIIGQIHDSIVFDAVPSEVPELLQLCKRVIEVRLQRYFPWLVVPMVMEAEAAPVGGSWWDKKGVEF